MTTGAVHGLGPVPAGEGCVLVTQCHMHLWALTNSSTTLRQHVLACTHAPCTHAPCPCLHAPLFQALEARGQGLQEVYKLLQQPEDLEKLPDLIREYETKLKACKGGLSGLAHSQVRVDERESG